MLIARRPGVNFAGAKLTPCGRNYDRPTRYTQRKRLCLLFGPTQPTPFIFIYFFVQTDLASHRASRRRTTTLVVPILEAPTHTLSE